MFPAEYDPREEGIRMCARRCWDELVAPVMPRAAEGGDSMLSTPLLEELRRVARARVLGTLPPLVGIEVIAAVAERIELLDRERRDDP